MAWKVINMSFKEIRKQCDAAGCIVQEEIAGEPVDVCGFNRGVLCCGWSCPSKKYWNAGREEVGKHKIEKLVGKNEA